MLDSIEIKNFRSCEDVRLRLGEPVVALLGKNGAGKTNVLHAVQVVADLCVGESETIYSLHPHDSSRTSFVLRFTLGSSHYVYRTSRSSYPVKTEIIEESLEKGDAALFRRRGEVVESSATALPENLRINTGTATLPALLQVLPESHPAAIVLQPVAAYLRSVRYYPLLQGFQEHLNGPSPQKVALDLSGDYSRFIEVARYDAWKAELAQGRARRSVQMRLLHLWLADRPRFDELRTLLGEDGLGLLADIKVEEISLGGSMPVSGKSGDASERAYVINFLPGVGLAGAGRWFPFSGLSAGTWRILQLLTYLIFDQNSCMLLEQPEDSIHPGLLAKVIDILRTYAGRTQLICTTHSPHVMNLMGPKGIRLVTAKEGRTAISELSERDLNAAKGYLEDEGTLAEFLDTL